MSVAYDGRTIADDMVDMCAGIVDKDTAVKAVRAACRYFGGALVYIPAVKTTGSFMEEIHGVLCDAVGDRDGDLILMKLIALYGGLQLYMPMEKNAFRKEIAQEIFDRYASGKDKIRDLCRDYAMSFVQVYRLWYEGRKLHSTQGVLQ